MPLSLYLVFLEVRREDLLVMLVVEVRQVLVCRVGSYDNAAPVLKRCSHLYDWQGPKNKYSHTYQAHGVKGPQFVTLELKVEISLILLLKPIAVVKSFEFFLPGIHPVVFSRHALVLALVNL